MPNLVSCRLVKRGPPLKAGPTALNHSSIGCLLYAGPVLAVGIRTAPFERRGIARGGRVLHYSLKGFPEGIHLRLRADGDAHVRRPDRPGASDIDIARGQRVDDFFGWALGIKHETVGLGGDVGIALAGKP